MLHNARGHRWRSIKPQARRPAAENVASQFAWLQLYTLKKIVALLYRENFTHKRRLIAPPTSRLEGTLVDSRAHQTNLIFTNELRCLKLSISFSILCSVLCNARGPKMMVVWKCRDHPTVNIRWNRRSRLVGKSVHRLSREPGTEDYSDSLHRNGNMNNPQQVAVAKLSLI